MNFKNIKSDLKLFLSPYERLKYIVQQSTLYLMFQLEVKVEK
jgi:hypothetical protein